mgnify:CR=1 FL=1
MRGLGHGRLFHMLAFLSRGGIVVFIGAVVDRAVLLHLLGHQVEMVMPGRLE